ncbi:fluoride efflux transporter CrcB [Robiginitomaculum antarcticum]|uniref:fluoride efflux transporter CrcB n=1 Tax=Robiginitomaculum antarcticum TaxID=437507 RepID=UPI000361C512|nr:fluoride efflux transporter CrcB [Robiginitomaculum antarcticum]
MPPVIYVALGGAIGAALRYGLGKAAFRAAGPGFPWGTLAANILGGFVMGLLVGWLAHKVSGGETLRLFLGLGVLGGFTTFSAFSLETWLMIEKKAYAAAMGYVGASVIISIIALALGLVIARRLFAL